MTQIPSTSILLSCMVMAAGCGGAPERGAQGTVPQEEAAPKVAVEEPPAETQLGLIEHVPELVFQAPVEAQASPALPASLHCVSELGQSQDNFEHSVLRVSLSQVQSGVHQLAVSRGAMFRVHGESVSEDTQLAVQEVEVSMEADGLLQLISSSKSGAALRGESAFSATLQKRGAFFFGTLMEDTCTRQTQSKLSCWDPGEIFASSWGARPALPASFNWEKGECTDANGAPALNELPIEFVRETGFGVCADLRAANLNGRDYAYPELSWWNLQGANLQGAQLFFANLSGANLHGAKLGGIEFGYATIGGSLDEFTQLPPADCEVTDSSWGGATVLCSR